LHFFEWESGAPEVFPSYWHSQVPRAWTRPSWVSQACVFVYIRNSGWRPHKELVVTGICRAPTDQDWSYSFRRSPTMLRRGLIFASTAFLMIFSLDSLFSSCVSFFSCLHSCNFYPLFVSVRSQGTSHYCAWGRVIKRPRTRSAAVRHWHKYLRTRSCNEREIVVSNCTSPTECFTSFFSLLLFRRRPWGAGAVGSKVRLVGYRAIEVSRVLLCLLVVTSLLTWLLVPNFQKKHYIFPLLEILCCFPSPPPPVTLSLSVATSFSFSFSLLHVLLSKFFVARPSATYQIWPFFAEV